MSVGNIGSLKHTLHGTVFDPVCDIVEYRIVEHERFLLNKSYLTAVILHINVLDIDAVNINFSVVMVVITHKEIYKCGFARACRSDDTNYISGVYRQIDIFKRLFGAVK